VDKTTGPIAQWFLSQGFRIVYASSAVCLLAHAELPGVEVRIGTVYCVVERDGVEIYRTQHRDFDPATARDASSAGSRNTFVRCVTQTSSNTAVSGVESIGCRFSVANSASGAI
jgi:hypothetical protein